MLVCICNNELELNDELVTILWFIYLELAACFDDVMMQMCQRRDFL
jgi:hypothetical protein